MVCPNLMGKGEAAHFTASGPSLRADGHHQLAWTDEAFLTGLELPMARILVEALVPVRLLRIGGQVDGRREDRSRSVRSRPPG